MFLLLFFFIVFFPHCLSGPFLFSNLLGISFLLLTRRDPIRSHAQTFIALENAPGRHVARDYFQKQKK